MKKYGSDLIVDLLKNSGIEYVSCNPGSSIRGIHDSIIHGGNSSPELITCCHEMISVAIAQGYAKAKQKPMAVLVHNVVGLLNSSMGIYNAWCDRTPVIIIGGTGPMDASQRRPWIDWIHTALIQGNAVRDFVKWDDQPYAIEAVPDSYIRAYKLAMTDRCGPVYLCYDISIQEDEVKRHIEIPEPDDFELPCPPHGDPDALASLGKALCRSKRPVIIADQTGRDPGAVESLVSLSELLSIPVIDKGHRFNFPTKHPHYYTGNTRELLEKADLVLALDVIDLYGAISSSGVMDDTFPMPAIPNDCKLYHITMEDLFASSWSTDHQRLCKTFKTIIASTSSSLKTLTRLCREKVDTGPRDYREDRQNTLLGQKKENEKQWHSHTEDSFNNSPVAVLNAIHMIWNIIRHEDWVLCNGGTFRHWITRIWSVEHSGQYMGHSGGVGLGYGLGASIGTALAYRGENKLLIDIQPDGDMLYTPSALWTIAHYHLPLLIIVFNNRSYFNSRHHADKISNYRRRAVDGDQLDIGTSLNHPAINFSQLAKSFGIYAERVVDNLNDFRDTLNRSIEQVKKGKPALIDLFIEPR